MKADRKQLIEKFQKWLDTNPAPGIVAAQCATIAEDHTNAKLQEVVEYKQNLLDKTVSMEETANKLFGDNDFTKGNNNALQNFRVHIKELFPFK